MSDKADLKQQLMQRLAVLEARVGRIAGDLRHESNPLEQDFEEQATQREGEDVTCLRRAEHTRHALRCAGRICRAQD